MRLFLGVISNPQAYALMLAGAITPILTQVLKRFTKANGHAAYAILLGVSLIIAVGTLYLAGQFSGPLDVLKATLLVTGMANTIYQFLAKGSTS